MTCFVQISDCHLFADKEHLHFDTVPYATLCTVLQQVSAHAPSGLMITGDISADNTEQSYHLLQQALSQYCSDIPWRVIPGNHDNNPYFDTVLKDNLLLSNAPWRLGSLSLIGLDTRFREAQGKIDVDQLLQVSELIRSQHRDGNGSVWCLAMHHPPYPLTGWMHKHRCINAEVFVDWLTEQADISCVVHGHLHHDSHQSLNGIPILGVPSTCWQFALGDTFALSAHGPGFRLFNYSQQDGLSTQVVTVTTA